MTKTLRVVNRYRNAGMRVDWPVGRVDSFPDATAAYLMRDAPGVFEEVDPAVLEAAAAARDAVLVEAFGDNQQVVVEAPEPEEIEEPEAPAVEDDLDSMSLPDIRKHAAAQSINVQGLRRREDVIAAIRGK